MRARISSCVWSFAVLCCLATGVNSVAGQNHQDQLPEGTYIVAGEAELSTLAELLDSNPEAHVSRLLLSDSVVQPPRINSESPFASGTSNITEACQKFGTLAHRILEHASPSLSALSYLAYTCDSALPSILEHELPNLTELTLGTADVWRYQDALFRKKSLTHLHLASVLAYYDRRPPSLAVILQQLQNLTHLRVSGPQGDEDLPALDRAPLSIGIGLVDGLAGWIQQTVFNPSLIPANFTLVIQPGPDPGRYDNECGFTSVQYDLFVERIAARRDVLFRAIQSSGEDMDAYSDLGLVFPLDRAVVEFTEKGRGGEGEWGLATSILF
ncbi:hypothetical protein C8R44DRAFT_738357 [Mycena epipterygia]|nr:hypothetical protein C8R44DRAFT_738357 [Mycena epipterygia]